MKSAASNCISVNKSESFYSSKQQASGVSNNELLL